jgi:hypothetical protein
MAVLCSMKAGRVVLATRLAAVSSSGDRVCGNANAACMGWHMQCCRMGQAEAAMCKLRQHMVGIRKRHTAAAGYEDVSSV